MTCVNGGILANVVLLIDGGCGYGPAPVVSFVIAKQRCNLLSTFSRKKIVHYKAKL